jgi:hypothetical protein
VLLLLIKHRDFGAYGGIEVWVYAFLSSSLNEAERRASLCRGNCSRGINPRHPLDSMLGFPKPGLSAMLKRKISCPCWESNPNSSFSSPYPNDYPMTMFIEKFVVLEIAVFTDCKHSQNGQWDPTFVSLNSVIAGTLCFLKNKVLFSIIVSSTTSPCE